MNWAELLGVQRGATTDTPYHHQISILCLCMMVQKDIVNFSFSLPAVWNETLVDTVRRCNWGHIQKHRSPSSQFSNCSSNNMVLSAREKEKWMSWPPSTPPSLPSPAFNPSTESRGNFFFSSFLPSSFKRWNRRCWMMDRCAGIVLFCSALEEIIDLHYSPTHERQHTHHTHTHISVFHPYGCTTSHTAALPASPPIKERMFISLPVFL